MIQGLHINSTAPFRAKNEGLEYSISEEEMLMTILSAVMWKKMNGPIKLYADSLAWDYYKRMGLEDLWDEVDTTVLDAIPMNIDHVLYWAGSKFFPLREAKMPVMLVDTDLVVWKPMREIVKGNKFMCYHREEFHDCYPPPHFIKKRKDYVFDPEWDWNVKPCNTALAYFNDEEFVKEYTSNAIDFMTENWEKDDNNITQMVFIEQRTVGMIAAKRGIEIRAFLDDPFQEDNSSFTHLWGAKRIAKMNIIEKMALCRAIARKISLNSAEEWGKRLAENKRFSKYFV